MKYTKEERLVIGQRMYSKEIDFHDAMKIYGISESTAHKCMTEYKRANGIPVGTSNNVSSKTIQYVSSHNPDIEEYMSMTKEELVNELIKAKANELRAKKGYEVKGVGANKEFIPLNSRNSKS